MQKFTQEYRIRETECDDNSQIRLAALWDIMQDAAYSHAGILGFSHKEMLKNGNFFVLSRMNVDIAHYPKAQEKITVHTYPAGLHKLFFIRKYEIFDESEKKIAEGTSFWILVDLQTARPLRPQKAYPDTAFNFDYQGEISEKIAVPENAELIRQVTAEFSDIDGNNHVNNARYIDWIENAIRADSAPIRSIDTNYFRETKLAETLDIYRNGDTIVFKDAEGNARFAAEIKH
ncbi:MAG: thioesterase [Oscillospiraceae bacterium]|nr:thioesterase [Oscillospiraceae bacterium]